MLSRVTKGISNWLLRTGAIIEEDILLYEYATFSLLINLVPLIISLFVGAFFKITLEASVFIFSYLLIRKYSGGFHLKSSTICLVISTFLLIMCLTIIKYKIFVTIRLPIIISVVSAISISVFSPIDAEGRRLTENEKMAYAKIAKLIALIYIAIIVLLAITKKNSLVVSLSMGLSLSAILQVPCLCLKRKT